MRYHPNLAKPEPKGVFTAENTENAEKNKEENLCALCVLRGKILVFCART
jgi:hypothetical protein